MEQVEEKILKSLKSKQPVSVEGLIIQGQAVILKRIQELKPTLAQYPNIRSQAAAFVYKHKITPDDLVIQQRMLAEEVKEYMEAGTETEQLDALIDIMYVLMVMINLHDFPFYTAWAEVARSNMTKSLGERGKGKYGGTVIKGKDYVEPRNLKEIIEEWRSQSN